MDNEVLHQAPNGPAPSEPAEAVQPSTEGAQAPSEGTGVSEQVAETPEQQQQRESHERRQREETAQRNQRAAWERVTRQRDEAIETALALARKAMGQAEQPPPEAQQYGPPRVDQFDRYEDYEAARIAWLVDQRVQQRDAVRQAELSQRVAQAQQQSYQEQLAREHGSRVEKFAKQTPDFDRVVDRDDIVVPDHASEAIMHLPNGPAILYAIGQDPSLAARMHRMSPLQQAAFVGQISAALAARGPQISKAPAPGEPVSGKSTAPVTLENANYDEFVKIRRRQIAQR